MSAPYKRRLWRGMWFDERTISAIQWVERKAGRILPIAQGSYNGGGVVNSAGTHDGGGSVDWGMRGFAPKDIDRFVRLARRAGFAAWFRPETPGVWGPHIHAILLGHKTASPGAKAQMAAYKNKRNGLANNAYDSSWRPAVPRRWNHRLNRPVLHPLPGQKLTPQQKKLLPPAPKKKR